MNFSEFCKSFQNRLSIEDLQGVASNLPLVSYFTLFYCFGRPVSMCVYRSFLIDPVHRHLQGLDATNTHVLHKQPPEVFC